MKNLFVTVELALMLPGLAAAQGGAYRADGYIFFGWGNGTGVDRLEHGGELLLFKGLGAQAELGAMGVFGDGEGVFSVGPTYHFFQGRHSSRLDPFVEGGYTWAFQGDYPAFRDNLWNVGAGVN